MTSFSPSVLSGAADRLVAGPDPAWTDPSGWGRANMVGWNPAWYQEYILKSLAEHRKVSVVGPHGLGKSATDAIAFFWFSLTREAAGMDWKVVSTAGAWRQLQRYLWPEIHKWAKRLRSPLWRNALSTTLLRLTYGQGFPVASDDPANIEGAHADEILYIIDEAKNVPPDTWDAIEGAMSAGNAYCLANSTPGKAEGRLYEIHQKRRGYEDWFTIHVKLADAIAAGRINPDWAEQRRKQWGEVSPIYQNRVLGEFSTSDSDGVIPLEWLEAANERWEELADAQLLYEHPLTTVAADVASEEGIDRTVIVDRHGMVLTDILELPHVDTMKTARKIREIVYTKGSGRRITAPTAVIDAIGVGTGVVDSLRQSKIKVDAFQSSGKSEKSDKTGELRFLNRRAEAHWALRDFLNPAFGESEVAIPGGERNPSLTGELISSKWEETGSGFIKIEDKDDVIKRLGRSPDVADAVVMAYAARIKRGSNLAEIQPVSLNRPSKWREAGSYGY